MTITAPSVSARLKAAGFGITQTRTREGIRVSRGALAGRVCVSVDLDRPGEADRLAETLTDWLNENAASLGWAWERHGDDLTLFSITHKPLPKPAAQPKPQTQAAWQAGEAVKMHEELRRAVEALGYAITTYTAPAQADITAARTALEAIIELAGGDQ